MPIALKLPEAKITIRHEGGPGSRVSASTPNGSPEWWVTQMLINRGDKSVRFRTNASQFTFLKSPSGYTFLSSQGIIEENGITPLSAGDIGQRVWVTPTLPSTNGREFPVDLVSFSEPGTLRQLRAENANVAAPFGVDYVEFHLLSFNGSIWVQTAPRNGGTYTISISFRQL